MERHAAAGGCGQLLDLVLAGLVAAPHRLDEARLRLHGLRELFHVVGLIGVGVSVGLCSLVHILLDGLQKRRDGGRKVCDGAGDLLAGISADQDTLSGLDILRAFKTQW